MIGKIYLHRILWFLAGSLSFAAALTGVLNPGIYSMVISAEIMPGVLSQDIITIAASITILAVAVRIKEEDTARQIVILGMLGYLFYAYGIYVIERVYNVLYLLYLAIFTLSFYTIIYGVASIRREIPPKTELPGIMRNTAVVFRMIIPLIFINLWIGQLLPLLQTGRKIEFYYSIYILDLCFVMPAFLILAYMTAKKEGLGLLLAPALFIKGFTLFFALSLGETLKPLYGLTTDMSWMWFSLVFSLLFLALTFSYLRNLRINT